MSLINDALKRASQSQSKQPPVGPLGVPLQPVEEARRPAPMSWLVPVLGVALLLMSGLFFWAWWRSNKPQTVAVNQVSELPAASQPKSVAPAPTTVKQVTTINKAATPSEPPPKPPVQATPPAQAVTPPVKPVVETPVTPPAQPPAVPVAVEITSPPPAPPAVPVVVPATPTKAPFPALKLQGIFYRLSNPSALINGRTVFTGDRVEGVKVVEIQRQSVIVERDGERKELNLD